MYLDGVDDIGRIGIIQGAPQHIDHVVQCCLQYDDGVWKPGRIAFRNLGLSYDELRRSGERSGEKIADIVALWIIKADSEALLRRIVEKG